MGITKLVGLVWLILLGVTAIMFVAGVLIEKNLKEDHPIMKWWRKHILAPDPDDNWKNLQP